MEKRINGIVLLGAMLLAGGVAGQVSTDPQPRNVLLEEFTAINCGNCPAGHAASAAVLVNADPGRVVLMNVHAGFLAIPTGAQPDLRTAWGDQLHTAYGISFTPQGLVSRAAHNGVVALASGEWGAAANALLPGTSIVNIAISTEFDELTRELVVGVEHYCTATSPGAADRLHVVLTEDHISAFQADYGPGGSHVVYDHRHVVRTALTPFVGEALGTGAQGESGMTSYAASLPTDWNAANMRVVAFVTEAAGATPGEVYQVVEQPVTGGGASVDDATQATGFRIVPNPASDAAAIVVDDAVTGLFTVHDATGRVVRSLSAVPGQRTIVLDVEGLPAGYYAVRNAVGRTARLAVVR